jgi:hypothetical protein
MPDGGDNLRKKESEIGASLYEGAGPSGKAKQAAESISDSYRAAGEQAAAVRDSAYAVVSDLEDKVRLNPLLWMLGALGLGIVLGSRRRR